MEYKKEMLVEELKKRLQYVKDTILIEDEDLGPDLEYLIKYHIIEDEEINNEIEIFEQEPQYVNQAKKDMPNYKQMLKHHFHGDESKYMDIHLRSFDKFDEKEVENMWKYTSFVPHKEFTGFEANNTHNILNYQRISHVTDPMKSGLGIAFLGKYQKWHYTIFPVFKGLILCILDKYFLHFTPYLGNKNIRERTILRTYLRIDRFLDHTKQGIEEKIKNRIIEMQKNVFYRPDFTDYCGLLQP